MEAEPLWLPDWERPIRIPERIAICHAEPAFAIAGEQSTWELPFELAEELPAGSTLKLQLCGGRNSKPAFHNAQAERPGDDAYLAVRTADGTALSARPTDGPGTFEVTVPDGGLSAGAVVVVTLGDRSAGGGGIRYVRAV